MVIKDKPTRWCRRDVVVVGALLWLVGRSSRLSAERIVALYIHKLYKILLRNRQVSGKDGLISRASRTRRD
jgi:hypothetical protein